MQSDCRRYRGAATQAHQSVNVESLESALETQFSQLPWRLTGTERPFRGSLHMQRVDDFMCADVRADAMIGEQLHQLNDDRRHLCVTLVEGGACRFAQSGRDQLWPAGSVILWNSAIPASFSAERSRQLSISIPYDVANTLISNVRSIGGLGFSPSEPLGNLLREHLTTIHRSISDIESVAKYSILLATAEMIAGAVRCKGDNGGSGRRLSLHTVLDYISRHLGDDRLAPSSIARRFHVSTRYIHLLFRGTGATVSGAIRTKRLLASKAELMANSVGGRSVTDIAMRYGFSDTSSFSRMFRREFGHPPTHFMKRQSNRAAS